MKRGFSGVGIDNPKDPLNIGSALRAAGVYGASFVAITGKRYRHTRTDTMKAYKHIPLHKVDDLQSIIPYKCTPVAVDIIEGATPLHEYNHPESAFYIFGAEDETLGDEITDFCKDVIYIPTNGCMNLAAAINVVLYDRMAKQLLKEKPQ